MNEDGLLPRAESEKRGPDSPPGKSFAEIAAMLMKVPVPPDDGIYQQPSQPLLEGHASTPAGRQPRSIASAAQTLARAEPTESSAPGIADTTTLASRATHLADALAERINAPPMAPAGGIDPLPPPETPSIQGDIVPAPRVRTGRKAMVLSIVALLCVLIVSAIAVDFDPARLKFLGEPRTQVGVGTESITPSLHLASVATSPRPARLVVESQTGFANEPLPLRISLYDTGGGESLVLVGLAAGTRLSVGTPVGSSGWRVSAQDIDNALAYAPRDFVGVMDARIDLRSARDQLVDSQVVRLEWIEKKMERAAPQPDPPAAPSVVQPRRNPAEVAVLLERAGDFLKLGDIVAARILLRRAADAGNAAAALRLGMTYDPVVLGQQGVVGFAPDAAQAREWYDKAIKLGSTEASHQLERLTAMSK